jgi:outer membrane protein assembly factor BamB
MHTLPSKLANFHVPSKAYQGYTLFAPLSGGGVWLVDMQGRFVHHWEPEHPPAAHGVLLPNGNLLYGGKTPDAPLEFGGIGGELVELDWDGNVLWKYEDPYMHHDFHRLPNGNTMVLRWVKTPDDIAAKVKGGVPGTEREGVMWADSFREISPEGKVVWEWLGYEHLDPEADAICPLCWRAEWTHSNSCSVTPDGDVITALLTLNAIVIIDKATGGFKWRWGADELAHPHNPNMMDNGNILVFDNGSHRPSSPTNPYGMMGFSRVLEVNPKTNEIVWEFKDETPLRFSACFISGSQRLPNGNTLICDGPSGRFFEVTAEKELVWEYINPIYIMGEAIVGYNNNVFLAHRYSPDYPGLKGRILDPNRFELTLRKKPVDEKQALEKRLSRLGY